MFCKQLKPLFSPTKKTNECCIVRKALTLQINLNRLYNYSDNSKPKDLSAAIQR